MWKFYLNSGEISFIVTTSIHSSSESKLNPDIIFPAGSSFHSDTSSSSSLIFTPKFLLTSYHLNQRILDSSGSLLLSCCSLWRFSVYQRRCEWVWYIVASSDSQHFIRQHLLLTRMIRLDLYILTAPESSSGYFHWSSRAILPYWFRRI